MVTDGKQKGEEHTAQVLTLSCAAFRNQTATFPTGWRAWENYSQGFYPLWADEKALCLHWETILLTLSFLGTHMLLGCICGSVWLEQRQML